MNARHSNLVMKNPLDEYLLQVSTNCFVPYICEISLTWMIGNDAFPSFAILLC